MKLLPSREVKNEKQSSALAESIRISEVRSELSREERELNEYKVFVFEEREKIKTDFDGKLMQWNDELTGIENQVKNLRAERAELLRPLDDFPDKIKENLASTDELIVYLTKRKQQVNKEKKEAEENNNEALKKLDELLEREKHLDSRELDIADRNEKLKGLEELTAINVQNINSGLNKKNIELMLFEDRIGKKEVELAEREKLVAKDKEQIVRDRNHIESQQQTLIAAYAEARKLKII